MLLRRRIISCHPSTVTLTLCIMSLSACGDDVAGLTESGPTVAAVVGLLDIDRHEAWPFFRQLLSCSISSLARASHPLPPASYLRRDSAWSSRTQAKLRHTTSATSTAPSLPVWDHQVPGACLMEREQETIGKPRAGNRHVRFDFIRSVDRKGRIYQ